MHFCSLKIEFEKSENVLLVDEAGNHLSMFVPQALRDVDNLFFDNKTMKNVEFCDALAKFNALHHQISKK